MVKSTSPTQPHELFNLNSAAQNVTMIPPNLHEAFSLASVYSDNMALSSYANFSWQTPWWPNNLLSTSQAVRALAPTNVSNEPLSNPLTSMSQSQNSTNESNSSHLPLSQHFNLSSYNNYLAPGFGSLLSHSSPITTVTTQSNTFQIPSPISNSNTSMLSNLGGTANISGDDFAPSLVPSNGRSDGGGRIRSAAMPPKTPRYSVARSSASTTRNCECPNCLELAQRGLAVDKKNEKHNCHIPGCMKVYSKSSHLKAHLRWHNTSRPAVYQQNRRNGELSHSVVSQSAG